MKNKYLLLAVCVAASINTSRAQWGSYGRVQAGWALGSGTNNTGGWKTPVNTVSGFLGEAMGGFRYKNWGLGLASGFDQAGPSGIPLLMDLRYKLFKTPALEIFTQQGWRLSTQQATDFVTYSGGAYWHGGLSFRLVPTWKLWISAGASYERYDLKEVSLAPGTTFPGPESSGPRYYSSTQYLWRGVLTIGWGW